jgi:hypothetical protein
VPKTDSADAAHTSEFRAIIFGPPSSYPVEEIDTGGYSVLVPFAFCDRSCRTTALQAKMEPAFEPAEMTHEFSFSVVIIPADSADELFETQDRNMARRFFPEDMAPLVMELVCGACASLIETADPFRIYRVTKTMAQTGKSLKKHHMLTEVIASLGFTMATTGTDPSARTFWLMERSGA